MGVGITMTDLMIADRGVGRFESSITPQCTTSLDRTCSRGVISLKVWMHVRPKILVAFVFDLGKAVTVTLQPRMVCDSNMNQLQHGTLLGFGAFQRKHLTHLSNKGSQPGLAKVLRLNGCLKE